MPLRARSSQMVANSMASAMLPFSVERTTRSRERRLGSVSWSWMDTRLASLRSVVDQIVHAAQRMTAVNEIFSHIETLLTLIPIPAHSTIARAACQPNRTKGYVRFRVFCSITGDANSTANMNSEYLSISLSFSLRSDLRDKAQPKKVPEALSSCHLCYRSQNGSLRIHRPISFYR